MSLALLNRDKEAIPWLLRATKHQSAAICDEAHCMLYQVYARRRGKKWRRKAIAHRQKGLAIEPKAQMCLERVPGGPPG